MGDRAASSPSLTTRARQLRRVPTAAEQVLWRALRRSVPLAGTHFRRQVPLGRFVADFACLSLRIVVEVDGATHGTPAEQAADARRTRILEARGFRVLRFGNREVFDEIEAVLDTIAMAVEERTPSGPATGDPHLHAEGVDRAGVRAAPREAGGPGDHPAILPMAGPP